MTRRFLLFRVFVVCIPAAVLFYTALGTSQQRQTPTPDAVEEAQTPRQVLSKRPEQQKSSHNQSDIFGGASALPSSPIFQNQPDQGRMLGFDFARDPLNAKQPMQPAEEIQKNDIEQSNSARD